jgi:hypothetical protein
MGDCCLPPFRVMLEDLNLPPDVSNTCSSATLPSLVASPGPYHPRTRTHDTDQIITSLGKQSVSSDQITPQNFQSDRTFNFRSNINLEHKYEGFHICTQIGDSQGTTYHQFEAEHA